jgi:hypothetical protein
MSNCRGPQISCQKKCTASTTIVLVVFGKSLSALPVAGHPIDVDIPHHLKNDTSLAIASRPRPVDIIMMQLDAKLFVNLET